MCNLAASRPFAVTTRELLELEGAETTACYLTLGLGYVENSGSRNLRQAIANLYSSLEARNIYITSEVSEALLLLIWTMVQSGDNIVVENPCNGNTAGLAQLRDAEVRRFPRHLEQGWNQILSSYPTSLIGGHA